MLKRKHLTFLSLSFFDDVDV